METKPQTNVSGVKDIIQPTIGIYPVTSLGVSFYYHCTVDLLICRKDGVTAGIFSKNPTLNIKIDGNTKEIGIADCFVNGILDAAHKKILPSAILCTPPYCFINDMVNELTNLVSYLNSKKLLIGYTNLSRFYFPAIILASNGIIYDEIIYNLNKNLVELDLSEQIINNICSKVVRASIMQGAYRENNLYYPHKKGLIKLALPKFSLFGQAVELLTSKNYVFSIHTNPHRVEFEKAMVNIATNSIAMIFALDRQNALLKAMTIKEALDPSDVIQAAFVKDIQKAIFKIGQKAGGFTESDTFEKVWYPRKEQILKHDSEHISSSLQCFKNMIKAKSIPEGIPDAENALIYPLKCFAKHYQLFDEVILFEELEKMLLNNLQFARKNSDKITLTF
ncbi:MAG: hypothetical protein AB1782_19590 [Cyanobacteriota bacterium]